MVNGILTGTLQCELMSGKSVTYTSDENGKKYSLTLLRTNLNVAHRKVIGL